MEGDGTRLGTRPEYKGEGWDRGGGGNGRWDAEGRFKWEGERRRQGRDQWGAYGQDVRDTRGSVRPIEHAAVEPLQPGEWLRRDGEPCTGGASAKTSGL